MGATPRRINGLVYGVIGYGIMLGFLLWAAWPAKLKKPKSGKEGLFAPPPHTTKHAGPHLAVPADDS